ncbi:hypothetical protein CYMTET_8834 [Cymbomonas tetramitiformis]|uniref:Uncharacterized protein n=1 Tax=Cymbomonas tetramitiformis TaxID=36881 RepID=A0AAE0GSU9_9CHLO|nr:hypothetical protein CYMTET_8834 [Cymbomonas tetramitiformis]
MPRGLAGLFKACLQPADLFKACLSLRPLQKHACEPAASSKACLEPAAHEFSILPPLAGAALWSRRRTSYGREGCGGERICVQHPQRKLMGRREAQIKGGLRRGYRGMEVFYSQLPNEVDMPNIVRNPNNLAYGAPGSEKKKKSRRASDFAIPPSPPPISDAAAPVQPGTEVLASARGSVASQRTPRAEPSHEPVEPPAPKAIIFNDDFIDIPTPQAARAVMDIQQEPSPREIATPSPAKESPPKKTQRGFGAYYFECPTAEERLEKFHRVNERVNASAASPSSPPPPIGAPTKSTTSLRPSTARAPSLQHELSTGEFSGVFSAEPSTSTLSGSLRNSYNPGASPFRPDSAAPGRQSSFTSMSSSSTKSYQSQAASALPAQAALAVTPSEQKFRWGHLHQMANHIKEFKEIPQPALEELSAQKFVSPVNSQLRGYHSSTSIGATMAARVTTGPLVPTPSGPEQVLKQKPSDATIFGRWRLQDEASDFGSTSSHKGSYRSAAQHQSGKTIEGWRIRPASSREFSSQSALNMEMSSSSLASGASFYSVPASSNLAFKQAASTYKLTGHQLSGAAPRKSAVAAGLVPRPSKSGRLRRR